MENKDNKFDYDIYMKNQMGIFNFIEVILWLVMIFIFNGFNYVDVIMSLSSPYEIISMRSLNVSVIFLMATFFPFIYTMSYGCSPVQKMLLTVFKFIPAPKEPLIVKQSNEDAYQNDIAIKYLEELAISSANLSEKIFGRSSLYLLTGVIISFIGLFFFYITVANVNLSNVDGINAIFAFLPKFGILVFIEITAFFFLRQYKNTMDEFRYYESLKRSRQETLSIIKLLMVKNDNIDYISLIDKIGFRSQIDKLEQGQTLDILESKKLEKHEFEILSKIIDSVVAKK